MSLLQRIKDDQLQSRKDRDKDKSSLLTTLIGEASMLGKNDGNRESTDAEVIAIIKKFVKNLNEVISVTDTVTVIIIAQDEIDTLEKYLPEQITGMRLKITIQGVIVSIGAESIRDMGKIMKALKDNYDGYYDGKEASAIVKELLK